MSDEVKLQLLLWAAEGDNHDSSCALACDLRPGDVGFQLFSLYNLLPK
jgi:hypothetical protein